MAKSREYHIVIDGGDVIVDCDTYELTYAHNGEVRQLAGCKALAKEGGSQDFTETWLSKKIREE